MFYQKNIYDIYIYLFSINAIVIDFFSLNVLRSVIMISSANFRKLDLCVFT